MQNNNDVEQLKSTESINSASLTLTDEGYRVDINGQSSLYLTMGKVNVTQAIIAKYGDSIVMGFEKVNNGYQLLMQDLNSHRIIAWNFNRDGVFIKGEVLTNFPELLKSSNLYPREDLIQIQSQNHTSINRYGTEFYLIQKVFSFLNKQPKKILSFGCSTGEETISLYWQFKNAQIYGCDIDSLALATAKYFTRNLSNIEIFESNWNNLEQKAPYDLIVLGSVLCKHPESTQYESIKDLFPFVYFDDILKKLDSFLSEGGIILIVNANYAFEYASVYSKYSPVKQNVIPFNGFVDKFDESGKKILKNIMSNICWLINSEINNQEVYKLLENSIYVKGLSKPVEFKFLPPPLFEDIEITLDYNLEILSRSKSQLMKIKELNPKNLVYEQQNLKITPKREILNESIIMNQGEPCGTFLFSSHLWEDKYSQVEVCQD